MRKWIISSVLALLCSCGTVHKSRRSETTTRDSSIHTIFSGTRTEKIEEVGIRPVVYNPGDYSGLFDLQADTPQVFETDGYRIVINTHDFTGKKPGKGSVKIKGKDQVKDVPVKKTTTITENGTRQDQTRVKEQVKIQESTKDKKGTPAWLWPVCITIGVLVFGFGLISVLRR